MEPRRLADCVRRRGRNPIKRRSMRTTTLSRSATTIILRRRLPCRRIVAGAGKGWDRPATDFRQLESAKRGTPSSPASPLSWSPDGKSIAIVQQATPNWGDGDQTVVGIVDVNSGQVVRLTHHKSLEGYPLYSPDGAHVAYWYSRDGDPNNENELFVTTAQGGTGGSEPNPGPGYRSRDLGGR